MSKTINALVAEGSKLKQTIKDSQARLKDIEGELIEQGVGDYEDTDGHIAKVIQPSAVIGLPTSPKEQAETLEKVRDICGDDFGKLFDRLIFFKPVKAMAEIAAALLDKRKTKKLIELLEQPKSAYVKWS